MAVFTQVGAEEIRALLSGFDLGGYVRHEGIAQGVENTNYHLFTERAHVILTLVERRTDPACLPFVLGFMGHLAARGISCPAPVADRSGRIEQVVAGRPAMLTTFLEGRDIASAALTPGHCRAAGEILGRMHVAAAGFGLIRENPMGLPAWRVLADKTRARADTVSSGLADLIEAELSRIEERQALWATLPRGAVHADVFPDNVFFDAVRGEVLTGVLDFWFSCTEAFAYDLMLTLNAWAFADAPPFAPDPEKVKAFLEGYQSVRPLSGAEREALPDLGRAAALRILLTRLHDWLEGAGGALVTPKDPKAYLARLIQYREHGFHVG